MSIVKNVQESDFEEAVMSSQRPVLIDFWAEWCGPCKALAPTLEKVSAQFEGKVDFVKINADENAPIGHRFGVRGIPTPLLLKNGEEIGRVAGNRSAAQLAGFFDERIRTVTEMPNPAGFPLQAFGGDAALKADCLVRLGDHMAAKRATLGEPMWDKPVISALSFVSDSADPDEQALSLGVPVSIVVMVERLSTYRGTNEGAAEFVYRWLDSVNVAANLSKVPNEFVSCALEGTFNTSLVTAYPVLVELCDQVTGMQNAMCVEAPPRDHDWVEIRKACKDISGDISDWKRSTVAGILESAAWPLDKDQTVIADFILQVCRYDHSLLKREFGWGDEEYGRFHELAAAFSKKVADQGGTPPRGDALSDELAKTHPDFIQRFRYFQNEGHRRLIETGRAPSDLCVSLTAKCE